MTQQGALQGNKGLKPLVSYRERGGKKGKHGNDAAHTGLKSRNMI